MQFPALQMMPVQAMTQQATRHARRVYVGGLPPTANEQVVFISYLFSIYILEVEIRKTDDRVWSVLLNC
jgi:splicing factor U2AF 65 kDa subunit